MPSMQSIPQEEITCEIAPCTKILLKSWSKLKTNAFPNSPTHLWHLFPKHLWVEDTAASDPELISDPPAPPGMSKPQAEKDKPCKYLLLPWLLN